MDYNQDIHLTLAVSAEQLDTINHLFTHYNWTYREISRTERNVPESSHPSILVYQMYLLRRSLRRLMVTRKESLMLSVKTRMRLNVLIVYADHA